MKHSARFYSSFFLRKEITKSRYTNLPVLAVYGDLVKPAREILLEGCKTVASNPTPSALRQGLEYRYVRSRPQTCVLPIPRASFSIFIVYKNRKNDHFRPKRPLLAGVFLIFFPI